MFNALANKIVVAPKVKKEPLSTQNTPNKAPAFTINMSTNDPLPTGNLELLEMDAETDNLLVKVLNELERQEAQENNPPPPEPVASTSNLNVNQDTHQIPQNPQNPPPAQNSVMQYNQNNQTTTYNPPFMPKMFFANSNVTINYHLPK